MPRSAMISFTFGLQPMQPRRPRRRLDATSRPSTTSGERYFPPQQTCWRGCLLSMTCWSTPSVALTVGAGSPATWYCLATRPMPWPPNLGQGANSALVDAVVLTQELGTAPSVMNALVGYDKRRRATVRRLQQTAELLQRLCRIEQVVGLRVRDAVLASLARVPGLSEEGVRRSLATDIRAVRSASVLGGPRQAPRRRGGRRSLGG